MTHTTFRRLALLLALSLTAACAASPPPAATPAPALTATQPAPPPAPALAPTPTVENQPAPEPTAPAQAENPPPERTPDNPADCPQPGGGLAVFTSLDDGFCFAYPELFPLISTSEGNYGGVVVYGPRPFLDPRQVQAIAPSLRLEYNGPAAGLDSAAYLAQWLEIFGPVEGLQAEAALLNGRPAALALNLPGFFNQTSAFIVANDSKYRLTLSPRLGEDPTIDPDLARLWQTVTASLVFFPPQHNRQIIQAEQVCPQPGEGQRLHTDLAEGYCLLHPADFAASPQRPDQLVGGPALGDLENYQDVRPSLTVSYSGYYPGLTLRQALETALIGTSTTQDITLGGYPALTYRNYLGPWNSYIAAVLVNGRLYTLVGEPLEELRWPQGMPALNALWNTALASIAFFDPWR